MQTRVLVFCLEKTTSLFRIEVQYFWCVLDFISPILNHFCSGQYLTILNFLLTVDSRAIIFSWRVFVIFIWSLKLKFINKITAFAGLLWCCSSLSCIITCICISLARKSEIIRSTELLLEAVSSSDFESYAYVDYVVMYTKLANQLIHVFITGGSVTHIWLHSSQKPLATL